MSNLPAPLPADLVAGLVPDPLDPILTRPLALHNGRAYAAAWPRLHLPGTDPADAASQLIIVRDDGLLSRPVAPAGALVRLPSLPPLPADRLWSTTGLQAYCAGRRPQPADVFAALTALFDRFIDFTGSLADQTLMTELLAAYVLATWFLPAFTTFSHLWLLGDTGAGKTRLLHLLTRLSHLGAVVPPYAPGAPLRDLAALGAALAVDNADGLYTSLTRGLTFRYGAATLRQGLFLAGARRDVLFPLHQRLNAVLGAAPGDRPAYGLTHLDAFGPRLFAAQQPPPPAVAARALFIQLLRSTDRARCLADPADPAAWPIPPRTLTDDLWALSLAHLAELPAHVSATAAGSALVGAYFQTWHPFMAVASWLSAHGVLGLVDRFRRLAPDYHRRTAHLGPQAADLTSLALHAIYGFVAHQIAAIVAEHGPGPVVPADPYAGLSRADRQRAKRAARRAQANAAKLSSTVDTERGSRDTASTADTERGSRGSRDTSSTADTERGSRGSRDTSSTADTERGSRDTSSAQSSAPLHPTRVALLNVAPYFFSATMILDSMQDQARHSTWQGVADDLDPVAVGHLLSNLGLVQQKKHRGRFYTITLPQLERLLDAYRLKLPPILSEYPRYSEAALRANLPPGAPGAPLAPPSPGLLRLIGPNLLALIRPEPHP